MIPEATVPPIRFEMPAVPAKSEEVGVDFDRVIRVLEQLEGGKWDAPGGGLCWTQAAWASETKLPYILAQRRPQSCIIARQRLERHADYLRRFGVPVTATILCESWRHGLTGALKRWKHAKFSAYAQRGWSLYDDKDF